MRQLYGRHYSNEGSGCNVLGIAKNYVDNLKTNTVPYNLSGALQQAMLASGGLEHIGVYGSPKKTNPKKYPRTMSC